MNLKNFFSAVQKNWSKIFCYGVILYSAFAVFQPNYRFYFYDVETYVVIAFFGLLMISTWTERFFFLGLAGISAGVLFWLYPPAARMLHGFIEISFFSSALFITGIFCLGCATWIIGCGVMQPKKAKVAKKAKARTKKFVAAAEVDDEVLPDGRAAM